MTKSTSIDFFSRTFRLTQHRHGGNKQVRIAENVVSPFKNRKI